MADVFTKTKRSEVMSGIRSRGEAGGLTAKCSEYAKRQLGALFAWFAWFAVDESLPIAVHPRSNFALIAGLEKCLAMRQS